MVDSMQYLQRLLERIRDVCDVLPNAARVDERLLLFRQFLRARLDRFIQLEDFRSQGHGALAHFLELIY